MAVDLKAAGFALHKLLLLQIARGDKRIPEDGDAGSHHLFDMVIEIESGRVSGEKGHRWLGYIQGVLVARGLTTVEAMKRMNFESSNNADLNNIGQQGPSRGG